MSRRTKFTTGLLTFLAIMFALVSTANAQGIERAYQKEFAYLKAQKDALQSRLQALEKESSQKVAAEERDISALQNRLIALQLEGDTLQERLAEVERDATRTDEHTDSLFAVFEQAKASLERYDIQVATPEEVPTAAQVRDLFASAMPVLDAASEVRQETGSFFLRDGTQVKGELIHLGRIATYGVSPKGAGALAPAGDGHLKMFGQDAAATAKAYAAGGTPESVKVFLYESVEKAVEEKAATTWLDTIQAGGIIAWVIVALGLLALLLAAWRAMILMISGTPGRVVDEVCRAVAVGRYDEARRLLDGARGATARVMRRALEVARNDREIADDAVAESIIAETPRIERFGTAIMVFAAVSPLLGLLGTVTGMIATFDVITEYGTGDPKMLSGGISEALITTQLGLVVAIPALLVGNLLNGRASSLLDGMEQSALRVLNAARVTSTDPQTQADEEQEMLPVSGNLLEATG